MPTLIDGREVDSHSPDWRHECLARAIAAIQSKDERREWLAAFEKRHGPDAAEKLRVTVRAMWERRT
jgi:hypothetical protein